MATWLRVAALGAAGVLLGWAGNRFTPRPAPLGTPVLASAEQPGAACEDPHASIARISVDEAKPMCIACTATFVDARSAPEYAAGHVTGALHLDPKEPVEPVLAA